MNFKVGDVVIRIDTIGNKGIAWTFEYDGLFVVSEIFAYQELMTVKTLEKVPRRLTMISRVDNASLIFRLKYERFRHLTIFELAKYRIQNV